MDHPADHPADHHPVVPPIHHQVQAQDLHTRGAILRQVHLTLRVPHIQLVGPPLQLVGPPLLAHPLTHVQPVRQLEEQPVLGLIEPPFRALRIQTVTCQQAKLIGLFTFIIERQTTIMRLVTIPLYTCRFIMTDMGTTSTTKPMGTTSTHITMLSQVVVAAAADMIPTTLVAAAAVVAG